MANETDQPIVTQQNVVTNESDTKTIVGFGSLTLPTPDSVKAVFKVITFLVLMTTIVLNGISTIPPDIKKQILEYTVVTILVLQKAEDFWGIKINS
jgi:hypothetical protein